MKALPSILSSLLGDEVPWEAIAELRHFVAFRRAPTPILCLKKRGKKKTEKKNLPHFTIFSYCKMVAEYSPSTFSELLGQWVACLFILLLFTSPFALCQLVPTGEAGSNKKKKKDAGTSYLIQVTNRYFWCWSWRDRFNPFTPKFKEYYTFSQNWQYNHLSVSYEKPSSSYCMMLYSGKVAGEIWNLSLLGVKGWTPCTSLPDLDVYSPCYVGGFTWAKPTLTKFKKQKLHAGGQTLAANSNQLGRKPFSCLATTPQSPKNNKTWLELGERLSLVEFKPTRAKCLAKRYPTWTKFKTCLLLAWVSSTVWPGPNVCFFVVVVVVVVVVVLFCFAPLVQEGCCTTLPNLPKCRECRDVPEGETPGADSCRFNLFRRWGHVVRPVARTHVRNVRGRHVSFLDFAATPDLLRYWPVSGAMPTHSNLQSISILAISGHKKKPTHCLLWASVMFHNERAPVWTPVNRPLSHGRCRPGRGATNIRLCLSITNAAPLFNQSVSQSVSQSVNQSSLFKVFLEAKLVILKIFDHISNVHNITNIDWIR